MMKMTYQKNVVWEDSFIFKAYGYAKGGIDDRRIAKFLDVPFRIFVNWKKKRSLFKMAITNGRKLHPSLLKACIESGRIEIFSP